MRYTKGMKRKILIPIIIVVIIGALAISWGALYFFIAEQVGGKGAIIMRIIVSIISLGCLLGLALALWARIREIQKGDEDDLSKY